MANGVTFTIKFDHSQEVLEKLHKAVIDAVDETAKAVEDAAKAHAPRDTGFLQSSIYHDSERSNDYGQAKEPPAGASLLPAESHEKDTQAIVGAAASYGLFVELGTAKMSAHPYLTPAVEGARSGFLARLAQIGDAIK